MCSAKLAQPMYVVQGWIVSTDKKPDNNNKRNKL